MLTWHLNFTKFHEISKKSLVFGFTQRVIFWISTGFEKNLTTYRYFRQLPVVPVATSTLPVATYRTGTGSEIFEIAKFTFIQYWNAKVNREFTTCHVASSLPVRYQYATSTLPVAEQILQVANLLLLVLLVFFQTRLKSRIPSKVFKYVVQQLAIASNIYQISIVSSAQHRRTCPRSLISSTIVSHSEIKLIVKKSQNQFCPWIQKTTPRRPHTRRCTRKNAPLTTSALLRP